VSAGGEQAVKTHTRPRFRLSVATIVLSAALATGCAAGGPDKTTLETRLVQAGVKPKQAACVLDKMVDKFGPASLTARAAPIAAETRAETALLRACGVATSPRR
jgi:hypothetical protein